MEAYQAVFRRMEKKYWLTAARKRELVARLTAAGMCPDARGAYTIRNLYLDTPDFLLIRRSLEKPAYKEKLRIRTYGDPREAFLELKKKYKGVVGKRRVGATPDAILACAAGRTPLPEDTPEAREIAFALRRYGFPQPRVFIAYDREAFCHPDAPELRVTFDRNLRFRESPLTLLSDAGTSLFVPPDAALMEVKLPGAMPLWMARLFSEMNILPARFSKYGFCYENFLLPQRLARGAA